MNGIASLREAGLDALYEKASVHAALLAVHGPADAVMAALGENRPVAGLALQPTPAQALIAGPVFNAAHRTDAEAAAGPFALRIDDAGLYGV